MSASERSELRPNRGVTDQELDRVTPKSAGGREVRIGFFVLLGVTGVLAVLFLLTDPATFRGRYIVHTEVQDAGGIRRGDPVQMRGVNIGRVHRFELIPAGVLISLEIDGRWTIPGDSRARLAGIDLMGGRTVEVIPGSSPEPLRTGETMPGESVAGVLDVADELGMEARLTMERIRALLDESTLTSVQASVLEMEGLVSTLADVAREQRAELAELSASLSRSATRVEELTGREEIDRSLARADSTLAELQIAGGNLARATGSLETVMERIERGDGTLGRLSTEDDLYRNLNAALEEILLLARDVRENPGRYIRLRIF